MELRFRENGIVFKSLLMSQKWSYKIETLIDGSMIYHFLINKNYVSVSCPNDTS